MVELKRSQAVFVLFKHQSYISMYAVYCCTTFVAVHQRFAACASMFIELSRRYVELCIMTEKLCY
jgi:hypothetical protein